MTDPEETIQFFGSPDTAIQLNLNQVLFKKILHLDIITSFFNKKNSLVIPKIMTPNAPKLSIYPIAEIITFTFVTVIIAIIALSQQISIWLVLILILFSYLVITSNSYILIVANKQLKIIPLLPFLRSHKFEVNKIVLFETTESFEVESSPTPNPKAFYPLHKKTYKITYIDSDTKQKSVLFTISSIKKEELFCKSLNSLIKDR